jgi:predicted secreted protein
MLLTGTMLIMNASSMHTSLYVRDISTGQQIHTLVHAHSVIDMVLVPPPMTTFGGGMLVTSDSAGHVWLWDVHTG